MKDCEHDFKYSREETEIIGSERVEWIVEKCQKKNCTAMRYLKKKVGLTVPKNVGFLDLKLKF